MQNNFNELMQIENNQVVTTSFDIGNVFDREHKHVMRDIKKIMSDNSNAKDMFAKEYFNNRGRKYPMYYINRDGFTLVVMGFTGKKALDFKMKYIQAFNAMEKKLKQLSNPYKDATKLDLLKQAYDSEKAKQEAIEDKKYYDEYIRNEGLVTTTSIANKYGKSARQFHKILHDLGIIYKTGKTWYLYKPYQGQGYAEHYKSSFNENRGISLTLKWTQKGERMIYNVLKSKDELPDLEQPNLLEDRKDNKK